MTADVIMSTAKSIVCGIFGIILTWVDFRFTLAWFSMPLTDLIYYTALMEFMSKGLSIIFVALAIYFLLKGGDKKKLIKDKFTELNL